MTDHLAHFFLFFSHDTFIISFVIIGYIFIHRALFYDAICLTLLSMILNTFLKILFKIPLSDWLYPTVVNFPSGHMHTTFVLYTWLAFKGSFRAAKKILAILLIGIGISLIYCGYHHYYDVLGSIVFGVLLLISYDRTLLKNKIVFLMVASLLMIGIASQQPIPGHCWQAYYTLIGFMAGSRYFKTPPIIHSRTKLGAIALWVLNFFLLNHLVLSKGIHSLPIFLTQSKWAFIGLSLPGMIKFANALAHRTVQ